MPEISHKAVVVTGLIRNRELLRRCLAPFAALLARGVIDQVVYCTWAEQAAAHRDFIASLADQGVMLVTPPQPEPETMFADGGAFASVHYQSSAVRAALAALSVPDGIVLKLRSDMIMQEAFAEGLFTSYIAGCTPADSFGFPGLDLQWTLPAIFKGRIWIPWVDLSLPFMMADECYMGYAADIARLCGRVAPTTPSRVREGAFKGLPAAHIYRYLPTFAPCFPVFRAYERLVHHFKTEMSFKRALLPVIFQDPFFWKVFALHAFVARNYFMIGSGAHGDIRWYTALENAARGWAEIDNLKISPYYEHPPEAWALDLESFDANLGNYTLNCLDEAWLRRLFAFELPISDLLKVFYSNLRAALEADEAQIDGEADVLRGKLEDLRTSQSRS